MELVHDIPIIGLAVLHYTRPDGSVGWVRNVRNGVTIQGCNWLLDTEFRGTPQATLIYAGLISQASFTAIDEDDTHSLHPGWTEWSSLMSVTRPQWTPSPGNGGVLGTMAPATFNITADGQIRGAFLTTIGVVGSVAAGILYNCAVAVNPLDVENGGTLNASFTVRIGE